MKHGPQFVRTGELFTFQAAVIITVRAMSTPRPHREGARSACTSACTYTERIFVCLRIATCFRRTSIPVNDVSLDLVVQQYPDQNVMKAKQICESPETTMMGLRWRATRHLKRPCTGYRVEISTTLQLLSSRFSRTMNHS